MPVLDTGQSCSFALWARGKMCSQITGAELLEAVRARAELLRYSGRLPLLCQSAAPLGVEHILRDAPGDHAPGADHGARSDSYAGEDDHAAADPDI